MVVSPLVVFERQTMLPRQLTTSLLQPIEKKMMNNKKKNLNQ